MGKEREYMLLFLLGFMASCEAISCRDERAIAHNGTCYKLYTAAKTFEDAMTTCRAAPGGGHVVTVDSAVMQQFVKTQMERGNVDEVWTGARMQKTDWRWAQADAYLKYQGCFKDVDNKRLNNFVGSSGNYTPDSCIAECRHRGLTYAGVKINRIDATQVICRCGYIYRPDGYLDTDLCGNPCPSDKDQKCGVVDKMRIYSVESAGETGWYTHQPNDFQNNQACLAMHKTHHYRWGDEKCSGGMERYGYVCEYDSTEHSCNHRWDAGKCYSVHEPSSSHVSWYKARYLCKTDGGDLLQVDTKEFFDFMKNGSASLDTKVDRWWIGGTRVRWQWTNGEDMIFANWAANMPDSLSKTCAVVGRDVGQGYEWGDKSCRDVAGFICQQDELTTAAPTTTTTETTTTAKSELDITTAAATTTMTPTTTTAAPSETTTPAKTTTTPTTTTIAPTTTTTTPTTTTTTPTTTTTTPTTTTTTPTTTTTTPTTTTTTMKPTTAKSTTTTTQPKMTATQSSTEAPMTSTDSNVTSSTPGAEESTAKTTVFTTGVIIGLILGSLFVLFVCVRLVIYCNRTTHTKGELELRSKNGFDVNNSLKSETLSSYNNPEYIMYAYEDNPPSGGAVEPLATQKSVQYSY